MTHDTTRYYVRFRLKSSKVRNHPWFYITEDFTASVLPNRAAQFGQQEATAVVTDANDSDDTTEWQMRPFPRTP